MATFLTILAILILTISLWIVYEVKIQSDHFEKMSDGLHSSDDDYIPVDKRKL